MTVHFKNPPSTPVTDPEEYQLRPNNFTCSAHMERHLSKVSKRYGGNKRNQTRKSHGLHVLVLQDMMKEGVDTEKLYPHIKHRKRMV